jgi:hypothetical protein
VLYAFFPEIDEDEESYVRDFLKEWSKGEYKQV